MKTTFLPAWVWRGVIIAALALTAEGAVLFPKPLHLVRRVEDPLARGAVTVHEYCAGNQVITVSGSRVVIADYDRQQLTEIDREAGTYSVTRFDEIAKANGAGAPAAMSKIDAKIDRRVALSREAIEVLIGAAFPNVRRREHDELLRTAATRDKGIAANSLDATEYGLPVEQVFTLDGVEVRNTILDVTGDLPPADLLIIPPGSKLVESHTVRVARELRDLDH